MQNYRSLLFPNGHPFGMIHGNFSNATGDSASIASQITALTQKIQDAIILQAAAQANVNKWQGEVNKYAACGSGGAHGKYTKGGVDCSTANGEDFFNRQAELINAKGNLTNLTNNVSILEKQLDTLIATLSDVSKSDPEVINAIAAANKVTANASIWKWVAVGGVILLVLAGTATIIYKYKKKTKSAKV